ncbi:MAG: hypothetical protein ACJ8G2_04060 [Burkholderiales bacterium]
MKTVWQPLIYRISVSETSAGNQAKVPDTPPEAGWKADVLTRHNAQPETSTPMLNRRNEVLPAGSPEHA